MHDSSASLDELASLDGIIVPRRAGTILSSRSELLDQVRQQAAEESASIPEKPEKPKKKKQKRKKSGYFDAMETLKLVAGVGALVAVLALVAWGYPHFRFPVGGLLCIVGFVIYLLGVTSLRQHVAEEGPFKAPASSDSSRRINGGTSPHAGARRKTSSRFSVPAC